MQELDSKIRELLDDAPEAAAFREEAHELLDAMSAEQIAQVIPHLRSLL